MSTIIGIVGSRRRDTQADFSAVHQAFVKLYTPGDRIVSGGCPQGGDRFAEMIAIDLAKPCHFSFADLWSMSHQQRHHAIKELGAPIILHHAQWSTHGKRAGFIRNGLIARDADILIASVSPDRIGGTEDTIGKFLHKGKHKEDIILC